MRNPEMRGTQLLLFKNSFFSSKKKVQICGEVAKKGSTGLYQLYFFCSWWKAKEGKMFFGADRAKSSYH